MTGVPLVSISWQKPVHQPSNSSLVMMVPPNGGSSPSPSSAASSAASSASSALMGGCASSLLLDATGTGHVLRSASHSRIASVHPKIICGPKCSRRYAEQNSLSSSTCALVSPNASRHTQSGASSGYPAVNLILRNAPTWLPSASLPWLGAILIWSATPSVSTISRSSM